MRPPLCLDFSVITPEEDSASRAQTRAILVTSPGGLLARVTDWLARLPSNMDREGVVLCNSAALRERLRVHVASRARRPELLMGVELTSPAAYARRLLMERGRLVSASGGGEASLRLRLSSTLQGATSLDLRYFDALHLSREPGFVEAFARTISELESGGVTPERLRKAAQHLSGPDKERVLDLSRLWARSYTEQALTPARAMLEAATLYRGKDSPDVPVMVLLTRAPEAALARFVKAIPQKQVVYFGARPVRKSIARRRALLNLPRMSLPGLVRPGGSELERLKARLFDNSTNFSSSKGPDGSLSLEEYASVEEEIEAAAVWVVEQIERGTALADIALVLPRPEVLAGLLIDRLQRVEPAIPAYLEGGRSRGETPAGLRVLALLDALSSGLEAEKTARILPWLRAEEGERVRSLSPSRATQLVYSAGILGGTSGDLKGGLEWMRRLRQRHREYKAVLDRNPRDVLKGARHEARRWIEDVSPRLPAIEALQGVLECLADPRGTLADFAPRWTDFLENWLMLPRGSEHFVELLLAEVEVLVQDPTCAAMRGVEVLEVLRNAAINAPVSWGRAGRGVFLGSPGQVAGLEFEAVRVLGFAEGVFPRTPVDDPVLPSDLRSSLEKALQKDNLGAVLLRTLEDDLDDQLQSLWRIVAGTRRRLAISAPRQWVDRTDRAMTGVVLDVVEALGRSSGKGEQPGTFLEKLRAQRLRPGVATNRGHARRFLATPRSLFEAHHHNLRSRGRLPMSWLEQDLEDLEPEGVGMEGLLDGLMGDDEMAELGLGLDDLMPEPVEEDRNPSPGLAPEWPLSASWLSKLLTCPYLFLQEKLLLRSPPVSRPPTDHLSLYALGELMRDVTSSIFLKRGSGVCEHHADLDEFLHFSRNELFGAFMHLRQMYPLRGGDTEIAEMERAWKHVEALISYEWGLEARRFEMVMEPFGFDDPVLMSAGQSSPLYMRGRIDRVDRLADGYFLRNIRIGRGRTLEEEAINPQRDLSLGIHVLALESILRTDQPVVRASYVHLTSEGFDERRFEGKDLQTLREETRRWLSACSELLGGSLYVKTPLSTDCQACAFSSLCGSKASQVSAAALHGSGDPRLLSFLKLKESTYVR